MVFSRAFALAYDPVTRFAEPRFREHRRYLADGLAGRVLDLGCGTGRQFPYFVAHGDGPTVVGLEPDPHMRRRARERADEIDLPIDVAAGRGERIPYPDDHFDAVVAAVVLCSVEDPAAVVAEVERVLRPGGEFRLFEHVHDDGWRGAVQRTTEPLWRPIAGGCHLTRRTGALVAGRERLDVYEFDRLDLGFPLVRPFVRARLRRRR